LRSQTAVSAPGAVRTRTVGLSAGLRVALGEEALWLALVLALAFTVRLAWVVFSDWRPLPDDDAFRYDWTARALADGQGYVHLNGLPTAFWPPGYPLLLAGAYVLFGQSIAVAQLLNVALGAGTVVLVYLLGLRTVGRRPALAAATIVALFPSLIFFTAVTLSEVTFTFLALLAVYLLVVEAQRDRRDVPLLLAAGLVLGFASLVRGQALLLPLVLVPFWLRSPGGWRPTGQRLGVLLAGMALIVTPWTVRNAVELHAFVPISTNAGVDFWIGHHEGAPGDFGNVGGDPLVFSHPELTTVQREVRVNAAGFRKGLAYAVTHPAQETTLAAKKLLWLYYHDEEGLKWNEGHGGQPFLSGGLREGLLALSNVYYFTVLSFLALGVPLWFSLREPGRLLLVSLVAYWTFVHVLFFGDPRFHAPLMPVAALLASLPFVALWQGRAPWSRREP
jgi:4-amino-4-deoxy-L-arabinose transferase-like glycosyltransferase